MPKSKQPKQEQHDGAPRTRPMRQIVGHGLIAALIVGGCATGIVYAWRYVEENVARPAAAKVIFTSKPPWMSDLKARQLAESFQPKGDKSVFDHDLLVTTAQLVKANPWVSQLRQIRRVYDSAPGDTLLVDCDFRAPMALAKFNADYWLVDAHGIKLTEKFSEKDLQQVIYGPDHSTNMRIIEGIRHAPPKGAGQQWEGDDLAAGLDLVLRLYGQPFAREIVRVDVSNFAGRVDTRDAQIVFVTEYNTTIRWGRPWLASDAFIEVPPEQKMLNLRRVMAEYGRVDAHQPWIDIRFDKVTYPAPVENGAVQASDSR